jgi:hypothetical protein
MDNEQRLKKIIRPILVMLVIASLLPIQIACLSPQSADASSGKETERLSFLLTDPVIPDLPPKKYSVLLHKDKLGFPYQYQIELVTPVCLDEKCELLRATLYLDVLGRYSHMSTPADYSLTKNEHDQFTKSDYQKLDEILCDQYSLLARHPLSDFLIKDKAALQDVDAVSGATPLLLQDAVVPGAAYTSWVLWRWTNDVLEEKLEAHTITLCNDRFLEHCLFSKKQPMVTFALQQFVKKQHITQSVRRQCWQILSEQGRAHCRLALKILTIQPTDLLDTQQKLIKLIATNGGSSRLIIDYFAQISEIDPQIWQMMAGQLINIRDFHDLDLTLELLQIRARNDKTVRKHVAALLKSKDKHRVMLAKEFFEN